MHYALPSYSRAARSIDLKVAGRVLWELEQITGKHYSVTDLFEYELMDEFAVADDDWAWLDADLSRLGEIEPYDQGDKDPETIGEPLRLGRS